MPAIAAPARCCRWRAGLRLPDAAGQASRARRSRPSKAWRDGTLSRAAGALPRHGAAQCGICTPGMLMAAAALLDAHSAPSGGGGRGRAWRRALPLHRLSQDHRGGDDAAARMRAATATADPGAAVGARVPRLDGAAKVDRHASCSAPMPFRRTRFVLRVVRSPHHHAQFRLRRSRRLCARASRHRARCFTAADVPGRNCFGVDPAFRRPAGLAEEEHALPGRSGRARSSAKPTSIAALDCRAFPGRPGSRCRRCSADAARRLGVRTAASMPADRQSS